MAKKVRLSDDSGVTWASLPVQDPTLAVTQTTADTSKHGQTFNSIVPTITEWTIDSGDTVVDVAGYCAKILREGTPVATTGEAMTSLSAAQYQITDTTKRIWDKDATITVYDDAVDVTADVETYNYLFGIVTFASGSEPAGTVTIDVTYIPTATFGRPLGFTLTQTAEAVDDSDMNILCANGGWMLNKPGQREVTLSIDGLFDTTEDFYDTLTARDLVILEIDPFNDGLSIARGYFYLVNVSQNGGVGENEAQTLEFQLNAPSPDYVPFQWQHQAGTQIPAATLIALNAWQDEVTADVQYLPNDVGGTGGKEGEVVITDVSLAAGSDSVVTFTVNMTGSNTLADA